MDHMNTLVAYMRPCGKSSPVSDRLWAYDTSPVLRKKLNTTSCSEHKRLREEGEMGTKGHLPAKAADTLMSSKYGSVPLKVDHPPPISIDGDVTLTFKKTTRDQDLS
jgi:hypothetical protein